MIKTVVTILGITLSVFVYGQKQSSILSFEFIDTTNTIVVDVLKFYVSNISFVNAAKSERELISGNWLIDFENEESKSITFNSNLNESFNTIEFTLGTDSVVNVSGAFDGALDPIHGMYWAWNSGYINTKLEGSLNIEGRDSAPFEYHLGGYSGEYKTARKVSLKLPSEFKENVLIQIDLNYVIDFIDLSRTNRVMSPGRKASLLSTIFSESFKVIE